MSNAVVPLKPRGFGHTLRRDAWWVQPALVLAGLLVFILYSTWAALQGDHYHYAGGGANYLSPFYSPVLFDSPGIDSGHAWFGPRPDWWPQAIPFSPAVLILWAPGFFRFTCYYYRGAYYKAFWADPPSCAVGEPRKGYWGENYPPLILQNVHRYFMYLGMIFLVILARDVWQALWFTEADGHKHFGIGVGTLVLAVNVVLLGSYALGCHSLRHLVGGLLDEISRSAPRYTMYRCVTCLNQRHALWAWLSLLSVGFADLYVRLCSMGIWADWRLL